jgi:hypothetical protein
VRGRLQERLQGRTILFLALLLFCVGLGWLAVKNWRYALLGVGVSIVGLALLRISTKWWLWAAILFAPVDIYRIEYTAFNLSLYRVLLLGAASSFLVRTFGRRGRPLRAHRGFMGLFGVYALATCAYFLSTKYEIVDVGEVLNVSSGLLIIVLFYLVFDNYDDWRHTVGVFISSGVWVILGLGYTYGLFFLKGQLVREIPFRSIFPFELASGGWLTNIHNVAGVPKLALPFSSPPHLAGFILVLLNLLAAKVLFGGGLKRKRLWLLPYAVLLLVALLLTFARSGWLGFAGGLCILVLQVFRLRRKWMLRMLMLLSSVMMLVMLGIVVFAPHDIRSSFSSRFVVGPETDLGGHLRTRMEALGIWMIDVKSFLFGIGFSNYPVYGSGIHSHSPYTTVLAERGLVGSLFFWMFYFGSSWWVWRRSISLWRQRDYEGYSMLLGVFAATVGVLFGSLFYEYIHRNVVWILFALATATIRPTGWEVPKQSRFGATRAEA